MNDNPYLDNMKPAPRGAFEIDARVRGEEEQAIRLAKWYETQMAPRSPRKAFPVQRLLNSIGSFIASLGADHAGQLASADQK